MTALLIANNAGNVPVYLETSACSPALGLVSTDVTASIRKYGSTSFTLKTLAPIVSATNTIGSGVDGTVTVSVPGVAGNSWTVEVVVPLGTSPLAVTVVGTAITVNLAVVSGVPNNVANTATLVAAAIDAASALVTATASGTGASPLTIAEGPKTLTGGSDGDFIELGNGYYQVNLSASETNTAGQLLVRISGASIKTAIVDAYVSAEVPVPTPTLLTIPQTAITGYVFDPTGTPYQNAVVNVRTLAQPTVVHPGQEGISVSTSLMTTKTDSTGYFTISLITGTQVEFFIPAVNYRRVITVPATTANIFDIP